VFYRQILFMKPLLDFEGLVFPVFCTDRLCVRAHFWLCHLKGSDIFKGLNIFKFEDRNLHAMVCVLLSLFPCGYVFFVWFLIVVTQFDSAVFNAGVGTAL
jgi:hypothetical protein